MLAPQLPQCPPPGTVAYRPGKTWQPTCSQSNPPPSHLTNKASVSGNERMQGTCVSIRLSKGNTTEPFRAKHFPLKNIFLSAYAPTEHFAASFTQTIAPHTKQRLAADDTHMVWQTQPGCVLTFSSVNPQLKCALLALKNNYSGDRDNRLDGRAGGASGKDAISHVPPGEESEGFYSRYFLTPDKTSGTG